MKWNALSSEKIYFFLYQNKVVSRIWKLKWKQNFMIYETVEYFTSSSVHPEVHVKENIWTDTEHKCKPIKETETRQVL